MTEHDQNEKWTKNQNGPSNPTCLFKILDNKYIKLESNVSNQKNFHFSYRVFCNKPPWWVNHRLYLVFNCFFLGPLYRVIYWCNVRVVKLHFRKSFNTEEDNSSISTGNPYKNYVENFSLKPESEQDDYMGFKSFKNQKD